jgi:UDP-N-acetylglucosamine 4,6-dehydratase
LIEKSILVTGGSGFFARGFVRKALELGAERVCVYSRGEYAQHLMREEFGGDKRLRFFIGCVRDAQRLTEAMHGVQLVIHAAALKRIEVGHYNPEEVIKTNVDGTRNVVTAARAAGVAKVVGISSDKAAEAASIYGITKAAGECILLAANQTRGANGPIYSTCRYGNVWNSTGSIVPSWRSMVDRGATSLPVTDPECTRFFMRRSEAVDLVVNTARTMRGGELAIPELPAYRVGDLAEAFGLPMRITGLGKFEKLHEAMAPGNTSDKARRMSVDELRKELADAKIS